MHVRRMVDADKMMKVIDPEIKAVIDIHIQAWGLARTIMQYQGQVKECDFIYTYDDNLDAETIERTKVCGYVLLVERTDKDYSKQDFKVCKSALTEQSEVFNFWFWQKPQ